MKPLLLLFFLLISIQSFAPELTEKQQEAIKAYFSLKAKNTKLYNSVISSLKKNEGLVLTPYYCPSNHLTIGYGHLIKKNEQYNTITIIQADSLLKADFDKRLNLINDTLEYNKRLAIAHFVFNVGIGNYLRSNLYKKIKMNKNIDKEIVKWCYYTRKDGKKIKSNWLLQARKFELELFNLNQTS